MTKPYEPLRRINARIDHVAEEQLRFVTEHTRMNVTEVLKTSIALMYEKISHAQEAPIEVLHRHVFIGMAASGASEVSENTKCEILKSLVAKLRPAKPLSAKINRRADR